LLLLSLRPGAGALFDGHRISFSIIATQDPDPPQTLPVGLSLSRGNIPANTKG
jgi:hypothetical protein